MLASVALRLSRSRTPPVRRLAEQTNHIVHWSEFDRGGHFAAMEEPGALIEDVQEIFRRFRSAP